MLHCVVSAAYLIPSKYLVILALLIIFFSKPNFLVVTLFITTLPSYRAPQITVLFHQLHPASRMLAYCFYELVRWTILYLVSAHYGENLGL